MKQQVLPWGFHTWHAIHYVALGYPDAPTEQDTRIYNEFFSSLGYVLPCKLCTGHYADHVVKYPISLTNRESLFKWTVDIHNSVNRSLGKKEFTVDEARTYLINLAALPNQLNSVAPGTADATKSHAWIVWAVSIFVFILVAIIIAWILYKKAHKK